MCFEKDMISESMTSWAGRVDSRSVEYMLMSLNGIIIFLSDNLHNEKQLEVFNLNTRKIKMNHERLICNSSHLH